MAPLIGEDALALEGIVRRWDSAEVELSLVRVEHRGPRGVQWGGERVTFRADALRDVRERKLDTGRTAGFVAAVAAGAVALAVLFIRYVVSSDDGGPGGTDPPQ
jgi:hypothetical protein